MLQPIVSKLYCSQRDTFFLLRRRPKVANGGGLTVVDASQRLVFTVEGCGILGKKDELLLKDADGNALLLIRHTQGGIIEALALTRKWKGFSYDNYSGPPKPVFTLKQPISCFSVNSSIKISAGSTGFAIRGNLWDGSCTVVNCYGQLIAEVEVKNVEDMYSVKIMGGADQVFVIGVIAVLDYINGGSTAC